MLCYAGLVPVMPANADEPLITVILPNSLPRYQKIHQVFLGALQPYCGTDCRVYVQTPNADVMSLRNSVRKANALGSRLLVTYGVAATSAAKLENPGLPVLFVDVPDPEALGFGVGKGMAGVRGDAPLPALFAFFLDSTKATSLAILYEKSSIEGNYQKDALLQAAQRRNVTVRELAVGLDDDPVTVMRTLTSHVDGLFLTNGELLAAQVSDIVAMSGQRRIPVISQIPGSADLGAFMSLETDATEQGELLAVLAGQVLTSGKASLAGIVKPRRVTFIINMKTAQSLDLHIPLQTLAAATRVVR